MFLRRTSACSEFCERLGQANHLLITILIGIEGVRIGDARKSDDFHAAWNPKSLEETAQRSRRFARDAMLNHIVDSLGVYLSLLKGSLYEHALPSLYSISDRSLKLRLDAFAQIWVLRCRRGSHWCTWRFNGEIVDFTQEPPTRLKNNTKRR